jgi:hypothetical protein
MGKGVKGVALNVTSQAGTVDKTCIKVRIVADQYRPVASRIPNFFPNPGKKVPKRNRLRQCSAKGILRVDARKLKCRCFNVGTFERLHIKAYGVSQNHFSSIVYVNQCRSYLEQRVGCSIKPPRLYIDNNR